MDRMTEVWKCKNPPKMFVIFPKDEVTYLSLMALGDSAMSTVLSLKHCTILEFQVQHTARTDLFSRMASELAGARVCAHRMFCLKTKPKIPLHFFSCGLTSFLIWAKVLQQTLTNHKRDHNPYDSVYMKWMAGSCRLVLGARERLAGQRSFLTRLRRRSKLDRWHD